MNDPRRTPPTDPDAHTEGAPDAGGSRPAEAGRAPWSVVEPPRDGRPNALPPGMVTDLAPRRRDRTLLARLTIGGAAIALIVAGAYAGQRYLLAGDGDGETAPAPVLTGTLVVQTEPAGATLFVDGRERGTTPQTVPELRTGSHRVRVVLAGRQTQEGTVEIRAGRTRTVTQALPPLEPEGPIALGRLTLTSHPDAEVFLRGQPLGHTPLSNVEVPAGLLPLELRTPDGQRHRRGVIVRSDDLTSAHLDLTRQP